MTHSPTRGHAGRLVCVTSSSALTARPQLSTDTEFNVSSVSVPKNNLPENYFHNQEAIFRNYHLIPAGPCKTGEIEGFLAFLQRPM